MIALSEHFTTKKLIRFTFPTIIMMIFTSIYGVVDGFFVSNFAGKSAFAAVNFIMPFLMILGSIGFMFGTGGSAYISKTMGEGKTQKANQIFTQLIFVSLVCGIVFAVLGILLLRPIALFLGADEAMLSLCCRYGTVILVCLPFYVLQYEFQCLFSTAGKPHLGLYITLAAGFSNMILDAVLVAVFPFGVTGAAVATGISQIIGGAIPLFYFGKKNRSLLSFCKFKFDFSAMVKICSNGMSELMSNISMSLVGMLYNVQLMRFAGEDGVAAYGVLMYVSMIFAAIFIGHSVGAAPIVGYHFGAKNHRELNSLLKKSAALISGCSVVMFLISELLAWPLSRLYVGYDAELLSLTAHAFRIFSFSFCFCGFSIFGSSFFTALNDGLTSALISCLRTMVFQIGAVLLFPIFFEIDGIWWSITAAEVMALFFTFVFLIIKNKKYRYFGKADARFHP